MDDKLTFVDKYFEEIKDNPYAVDCCIKAIRNTIKTERDRDRTYETMILQHKTINVLTKRNKLLEKKLKLKDGR